MEFIDKSTDRWLDFTLLRYREGHLMVMQKKKISTLLQAVAMSICLNDCLYAIHLPNSMHLTVQNIYCIHCITNPFFDIISKVKLLLFLNANS